MFARGRDRRLRPARGARRRAASTPHERDGARGRRDGQGRLRGRGAGRRDALRRLEEAARHRARAGARARAAAARRAHQPPRRRRHPLARGAAAARARGLRRREPRPLLPGGRGRPRDRAEPRVRRRPLRRARALQPLPREEGRAARRPGGLPGVAAQPRARRARLAVAQGPARTRKAQARIDEARRLQDELGDLDARSRIAGASASTSRRTERRTKRLLVAEGADARATASGTIVRGLDLVLSPGMRLGLLGANGSGKTHAAAAARRPGGARRGDGRARARPAVVVFDQHRSRLDPAVSLQRTLAPDGRLRGLPGPRDPRRGLGEALPVPLRAARDAGRPPLGRRAGARR